MKYLLCAAAILVLSAPRLLLSQTVLPAGTGDLGAQVNAAMAALPASGGKIVIQTQPGGQCYTYTAPIVITKAVILQGQGPSTCLSFQGSGAAISFYGNRTGLSQAGTYPAGFGLRDLTITGLGADSGQTGLALGGTDSSVGFVGSGLTIASFGTGLYFNRGVWNFRLDHSTFNLNAQSIVWPSDLEFGGENMEFGEDTFVGAPGHYTNAIDIDADIGGGVSNMGALTFVSCNFDDAQVVIDNGSGAVRFYSPHFENPNRSSGDNPFLVIRAYTAASDVILDGPDFYNDQNNPYPPDFVEIDGGPTVKITQIRSLNLDGTTNVPANVVINGGSPLVTFVGDAPLRATQKQYIVASGNPQIWALGGWDSTNQIVSQGPMTYSQAIPYNDALSPEVQIGSTGSGYTPAIGFDLPTGVGGTYYPMQIQENGANELDFCSGTTGPAGNGPFNCSASVVNGVFRNTVPDGTSPLVVASHTPPVNLNAWPATFSPSGAQIQNPHITTGKVILPASGQATVSFSQSALFSQTPACTVSYQTGQPMSLVPLSFNAIQSEISIYGQQYIGVYFICIGN
jgi:hypothetical protein